jgi:hypothetical protein
MPGPCRRIRHATALGVISMRRIMLVALLLAAWAPHAIAAPVGWTVTAIDEAARSFNCRGNGRDWTFQTTGTTMFRIGPKPAAFGDLKIGQTVKVRFHRIGPRRMADRVVITGK